MLNPLQRRDASGLAHILWTHLRRKRDKVVQAGFAEPGSAGPWTGWSAGAGRQWHENSSRCLSSLPRCRTAKSH